MANWVEGVKCIHNITCSLMLSLLLSVVIQAHIHFASDEGGEMTSDRIWILVIFYSGAVIFGIGIIATCMSNGYVLIFYLLCAVGWLAVIGGLSFYRMSSRDISFFDSFLTIISDATLEKWGVYLKILHWVLGISVVVSLICAAVMTFHFFQYKYI